MDQITKNAAISAQIVALRQQGMPIREAIDAVLGAGTSAQIISDLYDALRAKAGV